MECLFKRGISREHQTSCNCLLNSDRRRPASFVRYYFHRHIIHSNTDARSFRCAAEAACCIAQAAIYLIDMIDRSRKVRHSSSTDLIFNGSIPSYTVIYLISQYLPPGRSSLYIFKRYFSAAAWAWLRLNIIIDFSNQSRIRHSNNPIGQRSCLQVINSGLSRKN